MIMNVFRTIEPISWMLWPKWSRNKTTKQTRPTVPDPDLEMGPNFSWEKMAPRETEDNAYAKFWGDKQRALWFVMVFSGVVIFSFARSALVLARWWARVLADVFEKNENKNKTTSVYWLLRAWSLSSSCPLALELITGKILRIFLSVCNYYKSQMWT